jgi:transposase InsO family protein
MPWSIKNLLTMKEEFVSFAQQPGTNFRRLCRSYGISAACGYKWLRRYQAGGLAGLDEQSRRPHNHPRTTNAELEQRIVELRHQHPAWGGRKLRRRLLDLGVTGVPAASTITEILRRHGLLFSQSQQVAGPWQRFEHPAPNDLWQMDFKAPLQTLRAGVCHPFTMLDDHSRFCLQVQPCRDQRLQSIQRVLQTTFERYGLPRAILCDNGTPWRGAEPACRFTTLGVWLLRVGVEIWHGRAYHPQTQGKEERFHRTLQVELLDRRTAWLDHEHCGQAFEAFRCRYNLERPHQALDLAVPASRYQPSVRPWPGQLAQPDYLDDDQVRLVRSKGEVKFKGKLYYLGQAFSGLAVAFRPTNQDGYFELFFGWKNIGFLNLHDPQTQQASRPALCRPFTEL